MEFTSTTEFLNSTPIHNPASEIVKEVQKETSIATTSNQLDTRDYNNTDISKSQFLNAKRVNQNDNAITSSSKLFVPKLEDDLKKSEPSSQSVRLGNTRNSFASLDTNRIAYIRSSSETPDSCNFGHSNIKKVDLYGPDVGPKMYNVKGILVTPPIIAKNLPEIFDVFPIFGKPAPKEDIEKFYSRKIRDFVGYDLNDEEFENLAKNCSPDLLRSGKELRMTTPAPTLSVLSVYEHKEYYDQPTNLCVVKKHQLHWANDPSGNYQKRLKYRGTRLIPLTQESPSPVYHWLQSVKRKILKWSYSWHRNRLRPKVEDGVEVPEPDLEPGRDIIYIVRIYRPFPYNNKERNVTSRHSVFSRDVVLVGRQPLSALRDRVVCANDVGMRVDASNAPDDMPTASAKELFPSGFLFINNVFYVDNRPGCSDRSAGLRAWARERGIGDFEARDLCSTRLDDLTVRLGHPEVYVHQGNCEHLFTFSEIRLLNPDDPLSIQQYPTHTAVSQNQTIYCTTCAEFGAKWIVSGCSTVPFDPAYFCETCFRLFLYKDGKKTADFKAYAYRGNEINMRKPVGMTNV